MVGHTSTSDTNAAVNGAVQAALVVADGAPPYESVLAALRREVIDVGVWPIGELPAEPPFETGVVLLWLRPSVADDVYQRVLAWASAGQRRVAVFGCATSGSVDDSVAALAAGLDDFVAGRCSPRELAGRIRALARRVRAPSARPGRRLRFGQMTLDAFGHELWVQGRRVRLTATELSVIRALIAASGRALSRGEILDRAWGEQNLEVGERAVDNVVLRLRRKIGEPSMIETVRGVGFRLADGA